MISFSDLETAAPDLAARIRDRFEATGLALLGTLRADGSPRVSPIEVTLRNGRLYLGMMPGSRKHRDVERDPRVSLLTPVSDKDDLGGEGKLFGALRQLHDLDEIAAVFHAAVDGTDHDASELEGSPVFEVVVAGAAWQHVDGDAFVTSSWSLEHGVRTRRRQGATGDVVDVVDVAGPDRGAEPEAARSAATSVPEAERPRSIGTRAPARNRRVRRRRPRPTAAGPGRRGGPRRS